MILYRKVAQLRTRRAPAPEPPFWAGTSIFPYAARRSTPVAIDYGALRASGADRLEVTVCENPRNELERSKVLSAPVFIDATGNAESVFRRGEEVLRYCVEQGLPALHLVSGRCEAPEVPAAATIAVAAWPPDLPRLRDVFASLEGTRWGVVVPVIFPVTTELSTLEMLADAARTAGASFLAAIGVEVEPTARQSLAQAMELEGEDDRYALLFHTDIAPLHLATERHIAALAFERGMTDFVTPPRWDERSNWNAAVLLTLVASRMMAMELDLDLAGRIARSARAVAELDKPLIRIAEAASLSIVSGLDETSVDLLSEWLETGSASFVEHVNEQWRLRRG